jgi:glycosyltransferase involved in cell wall biosynthesis
MMRSSSLLFVTNSLARGGSENKTVQLANGLADRGAGVAVAHLKGPDTLAAALSTKVCSVCLERAGGVSIAALRRLVSLVRSRSVSTLVAVNLLPALYCYVAAKIVGRDSLQLLASVNTTTFLSSRERRQMALFGPVLRRFDLVLFGAESQKRLWRDTYGIGRNGQAVDVLYNGVDLDRFRRDEISPYAIPGWPASRFVIGTVGQFRPEKKQDDIIKALAALRQTGLDVGAILVGDGAERTSVLRTIDAIGLADVVLLAGEVQDVRPYLARMDVFILPSAGVETFSNAALEAMAMARPVVATNIGGMPEMLRDGGGVLFAPGDIPALVQHTKALLLDPELRQKMGQTARRVVEERFSFQAMLAQFRRQVLT